MNEQDQIARVLDLETRYKPSPGPDNENLGTAAFTVNSGAGFHFSTTLTLMRHEAKATLTVDAEILCKACETGTLTPVEYRRAKPSVQCVDCFTAYPKLTGKVLRAFFRLQGYSTLNQTLPMLESWINTYTNLDPLTAALTAHDLWTLVEALGEELERRVLADRTDLWRGTDQEAHFLTLLN